MLGQLIWTVVLNCRILEDLTQNKTPRYAYELNVLKGMTDMVVFCCTPDNDVHPHIFEVVYRKMMPKELILRICGKILEIAGALMIAIALFLPDGSIPVLHFAAAAFAAWFTAYTLNFMMGVVVFWFAYLPYEKIVRG